MANFKKTAALVASFAIVGALTVGGTLANFNYDDEGGVNTLAVGDAVDIAINEYQRSNGPDSDLEEFEQGKALYPIVGSAQESSGNAESNMDKWGMPKAENYGDKIVTVKNTGDADAYIRVYVAMPTELIDFAGDGSEDTSDDALHWNWGNRVDINGNYDKAKYSLSNWGWAYNQDPEFTAEIDGQEYVVCTFYLEKALAPGHQSTAVMTGVYLDSKVDYDDGVYTMGDYVLNYDFSKGINIPVYAEAIAVGNATSAIEAFEGRSAADTFKTWAEKVDAPVLAESADELITALADGDVVLTGVSTTLAEEATITLDNNITASRKGSSADKNSALTVTGNVTLNGEGTVENTAGYTISVRDENATLTINGGTYKGVTTAINVVKGTLNITGGFFEAEDVGYGEKYLINCIDANYRDGSAKVVITGGTFVNVDPSNSAAENPAANFVADGYTVVSEKQANGDVWYTVVAE